jgi:hypothetical protein
MKVHTKTAMALGVGYLLGRHRKLRSAATMAAATAASARNPVARKGARLLAGSRVADKMPSRMTDFLRRVR